MNDFFVFREMENVVLGAKNIRSAGIFGKAEAANKFRDNISFPKIFCCRDIQLKKPEKLQLMSFHLVSLKVSKMIWTNSTTPFQAFS